MIVALAFCAKDGLLAAKNLEFCIFLEEKVPVDALLTYDDQTPKEMVERVRSLAKRYFKSVREHQYYAPSTNGWPQAANHAFQSTARHVSAEIKEPFFWWEADAVPLRKDWLNDIVAEYEKAQANNKCFMGHHVIGIIQGGHMNGVGVYPADVGRYSRNAMLAMNSAWDVSMASQMMRYLWPANHLFQHCWATDAGGNPTNAAGDIPSFKSWDDIASGPHRADFTKAIYHRCKDGSFIDHYMGHIAAKSVPIHKSPQYVKETMPGHPKPSNRYKKKPKKFDCRILLVTYHRDFPWLQYCLKGIEKFGSGFSGITIAIPTQDAKQFASEFGEPKGVKIHKYDEVPDKGMVQHMERMGCADEICKSDYVLHLDPDYIAKKPFSVSDFIDQEGKPYYIVRTYRSLIGENGVVSDCHQWKPVAERALGEEIDIYTMCRIPMCFPREFYKPYRAHIENVQKMPFRDYVLAQRNKFPQTFADFPTMGAFAWAHMHNKFHWLEVGKDEIGEDLFAAFWSHGGLSQKVPSSGWTAEQTIRELLK